MLGLPFLGSAAGKDPGILLLLELLGMTAPFSAYGKAAGRLSG